MSRMLLTATLLGLGCHYAQGAPARPAPAFEAASIKPSRAARAGGEGSGRERISWSPTSLTLENASLNACIQWAYDVKFYQVSGPAWLIDKRYDVLAKSEKPATVEQLRLMLRTLLADRFQLALHRTLKEMPVYQLVTGKNSAKLPAAKMSGPAGMRVVDGRFVFQRTSMAELAEQLSDLAEVDRPVLDYTGLAGAFDFSLSAIPSPRADGDTAPSIFTRIQEELGLRLRPAKGSIEMLVLDHAERPSPN